MDCGAGYSQASLFEKRHKLAFAVARCVCAAGHLAVMVQITSSTNKQFSQETSSRSASFMVKAMFMELSC